MHAEPSLTYNFLNQSKKAMELQLLLFVSLLSVFAFHFFSRLCFLGNGQKLPGSPGWGLPVIGHMHLLDPLLHHSLHRLSLKYGPLFSLRFGSVPSVVASSPHFAKLFLQTNELAFNCRIQSTAIKRLTYDSSLAFAPYAHYWRFIKKLTINDLLGSRTIHTFHHLRAQETRRLLKLLAQKSMARESVNLTEELLKLSNNVISKMMLGEAEEARDVVRGVTKIFGEFNVSDFIWLFKKFDFQGFGKRTEDLFKRFDTFVERIISKREEIRKLKPMHNGDSRKSENEIRDFLDILLDCAEDKTSDIKITRVHIKALIMDFFTAGTDTTSISIEWALVELIKHPLLLQQARQEIDNVVGKTRLVEESDCVNLPYLQAIVKETFRLHPPVPLITRRCVANCKIEKYVIPKDTILFVNVWSMGRDPNNWDNPLEFHPERFLQIGEKDSTGLIDVKGHHFQLLPFGSGRRMCPGVTLSMTQVPALLGAIIQCFDFQVVDPKGEVLKGNDIVINMNERSGLTAPRAHDLVCVPVERFSCSQILDY